MLSWCIFSFAHCIWCAPGSSLPGSGFTFFTLSREVALSPTLIPQNCVPVGRPYHSAYFPLGVAAPAHWGQC